VNANLNRFDLSDRLIHFFRQINILHSNAPAIPEHLGFNNINEDGIFPPLFMLRCAIRSSKLWATWSYRKDVRTIYGPSPAVCFTEMPIGAFLEAGLAREARGEAMSQFALIFPKNGLFQLGARTVIYGLSQADASLPPGKGGGPRVIDSSLLPEREQYRYVTYNPVSARPIDWSHEREWRWPYQGSLVDIEQQIQECGVISDNDDIPGLDISAPCLTGIGVVVQTREQAKLVAHDILSLVDRSDVPIDHFSFILCAGELPTDGRLRNPMEIKAAMENSMIDLSPHFVQSAVVIDELNRQFSEIVQDIEDANPQILSGEFGGTWLWLLDNTHLLTRCLLASGRVIVSNEGRYVANLWEFDNSRGLRQREEMTKILAIKIARKFSIEAGYFSVLNSMNLNAVPFYCDDHIDNRMYYNTSW
jgi:hypothetical protein